MGDANWAALISVSSSNLQPSILLICTSTVLQGANTWYRAEAPPKHNYAIMESRCRESRNLICAKVNMFVRLPLNRVTTLHKWFLVLYNTDCFSWLPLLALTLPLEHILSCSPLLWQNGCGIETGFQPDLQLLPACFFQDTRGCLCSVFLLRWYKSKRSRNSNSLKMRRLSL